MMAADGEGEKEKFFDFKCGMLDGSGEKTMIAGHSWPLQTTDGHGWPWHIRMQPVMTTYGRSWHVMASPSRPWSEPELETCGRSDVHARGRNQNANQDYRKIPETHHQTYFWGAQILSRATGR